MGCFICLWTNAWCIGFLHSFCCSPSTFGLDAQNYGLSLLDVVASICWSLMNEHSLSVSHVCCAYRHSLLLLRCLLSVHVQDNVSGVTGWLTNFAVCLWREYHLCTAELRDTISHWYYTCFFFLFVLIVLLDY